MPSEDNLTETQWLWLQSQICLDEGMQVCSVCDALGPGPYCMACGTRLSPEEARLCDTCQQPGTGAFCRYCGAMLRSQVEEAISTETFDWQAWARSLTPFLGPLTPQEHAALASDRSPESNGAPHVAGGEYPLQR